MASGYEIQPAEIPRQIRKQRGSIYDQIIADFLKSRQFHSKVTMSGRSVKALYSGLKWASRNHPAVSVNQRRGIIYLARERLKTQPTTPVFP